MITADREWRFTGLPLSEGVAFARACLFNERRHSNMPLYRVGDKGVERELSRFSRARQLAAVRLQTIMEDVEARIGKAEASIFLAQKMMVEDESLSEKIGAAIRERKTNAEAAVGAILDEYESMLLQVDDEYIKERATDIGEVKRRFLDVLGDMNPALQCADLAHCQRGQHRVIVARELTPSLTVDLEPDSTLGFVTERGGTGSHAAILARSFGIPAVSGIENIHNLVSCGTEVLINGTTGEVVFWPSEETLAQCPDLKTTGTPAIMPVEPVSGLRVMANINGRDDLPSSVEMRAEGVGLYRTEFDFLKAGRILSEDEQFERYAAAAEAMRPHPVTFRMLDVGADKAAAFLGLPQEDNPYLGFRGSRLLLGRPDLFCPQARALARASQVGPVYVMYPMVVDLEQFRKLKAAFQAAVADIPLGELHHGVMIEVPSACLDARRILTEAAFASIGTNDLIQYLFAVDRNNEHVAADYNADRPVFWTVIETLVKAARDTGRPLSVCGEIAGNPVHLERLMSLGIRTVSVGARSISRVRSCAGRFCARTGNM